MAAGGRGAVGALISKPFRTMESTVSLTLIPSPLLVGTLIPRWGGADGAHFVDSAVGIGGLD